MYAPGGDAALLPTVSVPPIFTCVRDGGDRTVLNGAAGDDVPILKVIDPPLLPVSVASGPFKIETIVPGGASISKMALK